MKDPYLLLQHYLEMSKYMIEKRTKSFCPRFKTAILPPSACLPVSIGVEAGSRLPQAPEGLGLEAVSRPMLQSGKQTADYPQIFL